ncbi:Metallo-dependent phosphatase-like protein [Chytriomyces sp. MP71]|nr:Metallo-dependent phosphatase-like protein [Chytriomyces sp. MP71]
MNDVYQLEFLPRLATAITAERASAPDATFLVTLPGDFISPSLLSSLDKGFGMINMLNKIGVDYVCLGNHEDDVDFATLQNRINQSNFTWINTNIPDLPLKDKEMTPLYSVVNVGSKRVVLLGLCTEEEHLYKPGHFGGAKILPLNETALKFSLDLQADGHDFMIALTHQEIDRDRELAESQVFPLILGGHEHTPFLEEHGKTHVVKTGMDATKFAVVDIKWTSDPAPPLIQVEMKDTSSFAPNPSAYQLQLKHRKVVDRLKQSVLCHIPDHLILSSEHIRRLPCTMGTFLTTILRNATNADCCIVNAGSIRGNKSYRGAKAFTYLDLQTEMPFANEIITLELPGHVIADMVKFSRAPALQNPPVEKGGYLLVCDQVTWDSASNQVLDIAGKPLGKDRMYKVTTCQLLTTGLDDIKPLLEYLGFKGKQDASKHVDLIGAKEIIVAHFAEAIWFDFLVGERFEDLDRHHEGFVTKEELLAEMTEHFEGDNSLSQAVFENVSAVADVDGTGKITRDEFLCMKLFLNHVKFEGHDVQKKPPGDADFAIQEDLKIVTTDITDVAQVVAEENQHAGKVVTLHEAEE